MTRQLIGPNDLPDNHPGRAFLTGRTPLLACRYDQRFSYCVYIPDDGPLSGQGWPVVVAVHGTHRDVHRVRESLVAFADRYHCVVVVPLFPGGINNPNDLDNYKFVEYDDIRFDLITLSILDEVAERWGAAIDRVFLYGFSGGGQFVHRFAYLHPNRLRAVSVGAPGRTTLIDVEKVWPDGTADLESRFGIAVDVEALRRVPMHIVVGAMDTDPTSLAPGSAGGNTRVERAERLAANWQANGLLVLLDIVPDTAHDGDVNLPATLAFLETELERNRS
jgi:poly(3-hydroxybutyrate) depolymerase